MIIMRNKIPEILYQRRLNITEFHDMLIRGPGTRMSYPTVHKLATETEIPDKTEVHTLAKVAAILSLTLNDLIEIEVV